MKIPDNTNVKYTKIPGMYDAMPQKDTGNILTKAIKDYQDECLTGLTEEERIKIDKDIKTYLEEHELKTEKDRYKLNNFIKGLLRKYGFKGDYEDFIADIDKDEASKKQEEPTSQKLLKQDATFAYEKSICSGVACKTRLLDTEPFAGDENKISVGNLKNKGSEEEEEEGTVSKVITNPDGTRTLLVLKNTTVVAKFNLGEGLDENKGEDLHLIEQMRISKSI